MVAAGPGNRPIRKPMPADVRLPKISPMIGGKPTLMASSAEAKLLCLRKPRDPMNLVQSKLAGSNLKHKSQK
jgi:hypothetical protein